MHVQFVSNLRQIVLYLSTCIRILKSIDYMFYNHEANLLDLLKFLKCYKPFKEETR